ncbi:hypothetical protein BT96DRAFT_918213, partial [Gymnopus androsaceus JB14]
MQMKQDAILFPPLFKAGERPCSLHPANYVSIIRGFQPIHESLTIDPSLDVPLALRPPRTQTEPTEAKRNNVNLKPKVGETTAPAKVYVRSDVGDISIRMHREPLGSSQSQSVRSTLIHQSRARPRRGSFILSVPKGALCVSPALAGGSFRTVGESSCGMLFRTRECFVGKEVDPSLNLVEEIQEEDDGEENGDVEADAVTGEERQQVSLPDDEVTIEAKGGRVYLQYDDETSSDRQLDIDTLKQPSRSHETSRNVRK